MATTENTAVIFAAAGDNIIHAPIYRSCAKAGGGFDFTAAYQHLHSFLQPADLAFVNQESVCGGMAFRISDYPQFNSPHEVLDALAQAGFSWVNTASNHSLDCGPGALISQLEWLEKDGRIVQTGTNAGPAAARKPRVVTLRGVRVGLASYTCSLNTSTLPRGWEFLVNLASEEQLTHDMEALGRVSDIQVVSMHWGEEYSSEPSVEQRNYAQLLADLGVDVVIGGHPHVIQPVDWLVGKDGNRTLVFYSLGNLLSSQDETPRLLGLLARFSVSPGLGAHDVELAPVVTHIDPGYRGYRAYLLKDYTSKLAASHALANRHDLSPATLARQAQTVLAPAIDASLTPSFAADHCLQLTTPVPIPLVE